MSKRLTAMPSAPLNVTAAALRTRGRAAMRTIRQRVRSAGCDARGIALQTVVIMVVLLVIAGSVAAVLVSRGAEVTGQLEETGIGAISETTCGLTQVGSASGMVSVGNSKFDTSAGPPHAIAQSGNSKMCYWESDGITPAQCFAAAGGKLYTTAAAGALLATQVAAPTPPSTSNGCAVELA